MAHAAATGSATYQQHGHSISPIPAVVYQRQVWLRRQPKAVLCGTILPDAHHQPSTRHTNAPSVPGVCIVCRRCVTPAVPGCLALLQRHKQPSLAPLPIADGVKLVAKVAAVHVQGFDYKGRLACYELLLEILQV